MKTYLTSQLANLYQGHPLNMEHCEWMVNWVAGSDRLQTSNFVLVVCPYIPRPRRTDL